MKKTIAKKIFIVASEESGSRIGALLMQKLKKSLNQNVEFYGIGGKRMIDEGLIPTADMKNICHMGIFEVVKHIGKIVDTLIAAEKSIHEIKPDAVICIDSQDFAKRLFSRIKNLKTLKCQYVAPSVWAWRQNRAKQLKGIVDYLFTLFPFENKFFEAHGIQTFCVGHNIIENEAIFNIDNELSSDFFTKFEICQDENVMEKVLALLPGSRISEVAQHLEIMADAVKKLREKVELKVFIPTTEITAGYIENNLDLFGDDIAPILVQDDELKYALFKIADLAIAASGTVTLELGLTKTPAEVIYKVNPVTAWLLKKMIKIKHVNLVNILTNKTVYPELLQENATPEKIASTAFEILTNPQMKAKMQKDLEEFYELMVKDNNNMSPTEKAACIIAKELLRKQVTCGKDDD